MPVNGLSFVQPVESSKQEERGSTPSITASVAEQPIDSSRNDSSTTRVDTQAGRIKRPEPVLASPTGRWTERTEPHRSHSRVNSTLTDWSEPGLESGLNSGALTPSTPNHGHPSDPLLRSVDPQETRNNFLQAIEAIQEAGAESYELNNVISQRGQSSPAASLQQTPASGASAGIASQSIPTELGSLWKEFVFVGVCSFGQLLFGFNLGNCTVNQTSLVAALGISNSLSPWLIGAFLLANGLSVILSGSLADLASPKKMMVGAFAWSAVWNLIGAFSVQPSRKILFFLVRAMQGLAVGILVSSSMSVLGRIYNPGIRKNRVFSGMAAAAPFGFWLGCVQGGALAHHLQWIFGSTAMICAISVTAALYSIPALKPAKDNMATGAPTIKDFDFLGAGLAVAGCACLLFGLTQGSSANWAPYTYTLVIIGLAFLVVFYFAEGRVARPLIPQSLWSTPGFTPLIISYFLGFGSFVGAWQYYAVQFFLNVQHASSLTVALYLIPNALFGVLATFIVSKTLHVFPGHVILAISMLAFAMGPVFFLPQTPGTTYWALSMPGIALVTFGPDLSFAAASIYITSQVPRSYQGAAGSLLVTTQNLSSAIFAAVADTIGVRVQSNAAGQIGLDGLRAVWWFSFAVSILAAVITSCFVRIPKSVEKEHVS